MSLPTSRYGGSRRIFQKIFRSTAILRMEATCSCRRPGSAGEHLDASDRCPGSAGGCSNASDRCPGNAGERSDALDHCAGSAGDHSDALDRCPGGAGVRADAFSCPALGRGRLPVPRLGTTRQASPEHGGARASHCSEPRTGGRAAPRLKWRFPGRETEPGVKKTQAGPVPPGDWHSRC